jgi:hypothetical protein
MARLVTSRRQAVRDLLRHDCDLQPVDQSQAIALSVQATQFGAYGLKISGYQDTLLGKHFFALVL